MAETIDLSLNEAEMLAVKAARGAGLSWGHAEDLGGIVRWLSTRAVDWAAPLLRLLNDPVLTEAFLNGSRFADGAAAAQCTPFWLLPHLTLQAAAARKTIFLQWPENWRACVNAVGDLTLSRPFQELMDKPAMISILEGQEIPGFGCPPLARRSFITADAYRELQKFVQKTYVSQSAQSRESGAGAGVDDND